MALGGRFQWNDQGETPNSMYAIAEYPNGQQVYFNVRNVNHEGYVNQVENEYYFEDGGRIVRGVYYRKGETKGEKLDLPPGKVTPGGRTIRSSMDFCEALLNEKQVAFVPGEDFGGCGGEHCRISFACSEAQISKGMDRLAEFVASLR